MFTAKAVWLGLSCFSCALWNRRLFVIERPFSVENGVVWGGSIFVGVQNDFQRLGALGGYKPEQHLIR